MRGPKGRGRRFFFKARAAARLEIFRGRRGGLRAYFPAAMDITLSTPALLFPAVTLLMLAYTNRFVVLATLIRTLHEKFKTNPDIIIIGQIKNLRRRVELIKHMQATGVFSLLLCVLCMFVLFAGMMTAGKVLFAISLLMMMISLALSIIEIWISVIALNIQVSDLEREEQKGLHR
jgi:hypothetical protein